MRVAARYFQLTKPRVVELLLVTTLPAMILAAGGMPTLGADRRGARRRGARRGRGEHDQLLDRAGPRPADAPHRGTGRSRRRRRARGRARVRARARGRWRSGCSGDGRTCSSAALALDRHALLRVRVHDLAEAPDGAEHRHRRRGRGRAGPRRVGRPSPARVGGAGLAAVRHRVLLDPGALLGARAPLPRRLRRRRASRCCRWSRACPPRCARSSCTRSSSSPSTFVAPVRHRRSRARSTSWPPGCSARCSSSRRSGSPRHTPAQAIRLFTFSNTYLALLFAAVAVDTLVRAALSLHPRGHAGPVGSSPALGAGRRRGGRRGHLGGRRERRRLEVVEPGLGAGRCRCTGAAWSANQRPTSRSDARREDGEPGRLPGKPVVLNFWASSCHPVPRGVPAVPAQRGSTTGEFVVLGVDTKDIESDAKASPRSRRRPGRSWRTPPTRIGQAYGVGAVPQTFFIKPDGKISQRYTRR